MAAVAFAMGLITIPILKNGSERRLLFRLNAPYGSVDLRSGADPRAVAAVQTESNAPSESPHWSYGMAGKDVGVLSIGIGTDEGMLGGPPLAVWQASGPPTGFFTARAGAPESDMGRSNRQVLRASVVVHHDALSDGGTRVYLTRDLPIDFNATLGFGASTLDLTKLNLTNAYIETGAARAVIYANEPNQQELQSCTVKAGLGECSFMGISNLNAKHFTFKGAVGSYHLGFEGRLEQNLDARVDMGIGVCTISIPPLAGRVQVFFDNGMFSSYSIIGLNVRRPGYATSPGFELSHSPILSLHLSTSAGRMAIVYR